MDRRNILKMLPLAALAGTDVKLGGKNAKAFEMKPGKKYLFVMPDIPQVDAVRASEQLRRKGIDATICAGVEGLEIYELEPGSGYYPAGAPNDSPSRYILR